MSRSEKDQKTAVEGWIDERIRFVLTGLTQPFEKRVARLSERIQALQKKVRQISERIDIEEGWDEEA
jgi:polyhydroxyalkanoate synthesis regulator phasin